MKSDSDRTAGPPGPRATATRAHLRGSSLLLAGRGISLLVNFAVQVLTVRYLAKSDYGAFAYAFAVVGTASNAILLGLGRAVSRFAPLYEERRDYGSMYGALIVATSSVFALGLALVVGVHGLSGLLIGPHVADPLAASLLLVLIALAPLQSLDSLFEYVLAAFAGPWAIFVRRYVLGPALKLCAVFGVIAAEGSVRALAFAYVGAGVVAVAIYGPLLRGAFARRGLLRHLVLRDLRFPVREMMTFGLPLFVSDVVHVLRTTLAVVVLEAVRGTAEVADFRAIAPVAGLNLVVLQSVKLLYVPTAMRLFARGEHASIEDLFWQTAVWVSVATFPVLAVCLVLAQPVTVFLFGEGYAAAGPVLAVLAAGNYVNAAMGLNAFTLQVYARVRSVATATAIATAVAFLLTLLWVPGYGALGAAVAVALAQALENLLFHLRIAQRTEIRLLRWRYLGVYGSLAAVLLALLAVRELFDPPVVLLVAMTAVAFLALLRAHRRTMDVANVFPELGRLPLVRTLLGMGKRP